MITGKMHPVVRLSLHEIDNAMGPLRIEFRAESGEPGRIEITGDATGQRVFYVRRDPAGVTLFLDPSDPRHAGKALPHGGGLDPGGLSFLLQSSFCPFPSTPVADLDCIGAMDQVTLEAAPGLPRREVRRKFHFRAADSRQDQTPDPRRLLDLLCDATAECCEHPGPKVLMLSSGKDSVAIAAALSRLRRPDVECITFAAVPEDPEAQDAAAIAAEFKLRHRVVGFPRDPDAMHDLLARVLSRCPVPAVDPAIIPYVAALDGIEAGALILDGSGNDVYMGSVPGQRDQRKARAARMGEWIPAGIRDRIPGYALGSVLEKSPPQACFPTCWFTVREARQILPGAMDCREFWRNETRAHGDLTPADLKTLFRSAHYGHASCMQKARAAAAGNAAFVAFPWSQSDLIDYYFNLPEASRFDLESGTNKILLRRMLRELFRYDDARIGKRVFDFHARSFIDRMWKHLEREVLGCRLWAPGVAGILESYRAAMRRRHVAAFPLAVLYILSIWANLRVHPAPRDIQSPAGAVAPA